MPGKSAMRQEFTYSLRESAPEFRFAGLAFSVPAQKFHSHGDVGIKPCRLENGVFFSIKCSLAECADYILKQVCEICITVSKFVRRAVRAVRNTFPEAVRQKIIQQTTYLSCCVLRC